MQHSQLEHMKTRLGEAVAHARRLGADAARVAFNRTESLSVGFEAGRLKETGEHEGVSFSIDVLVDGHRAGVSGNRLDRMDALIEQALALARVGSVAHFDAWPQPGAVPSVPTHSPRTLEWGRNEMIEDCARINDALLEFDKDLFVGCSAGRNESESLLATSGGVLHEKRSTGWRLSGHLQRTQGQDIFLTGDGRGWGDRNEFLDPDAIAQRLIGDLRHAATTVKPPKGPVAVFLPPEMLIQFLWPILDMGIGGRNVAKGDSPLTDRLGERVLAPSMTIVDDPHRPFAGGAAEIDGDGIPTRRQTLFERGVLQRFLYDLDSARLAGAEPTGNAGCQPWNAVVEPGERPQAQLLADVDDGLFIRNLIGFGQSNIVNGDFSCNVGQGYRIRNGEIVGRVKDTMISGNLYEVFGDAVELSAETDYAGRWPSAVVGGIHASA